MKAFQCFPQVPGVASHNRKCSQPDLPGLVLLGSETFTERPTFWLFLVHSNALIPSEIHSDIIDFTSQIGDCVVNCRKTLLFTI